MARLPKTIAFLTDACEWGGAEVYLMQLLDGVRAAGLEPRVFCADWPDADAWIEELKLRGYQVERFLSILRQAHHVYIRFQF